MIGIIFSINKLEFSIFTLVKLVFFTTGIFVAYQLFLLIANLNAEVLKLINKIKRGE